MLAKDIYIWVFLCRTQVGLKMGKEVIFMLATLPPTKSSLKNKFLPAIASLQAK